MDSSQMNPLSLNILIPIIRIVSLNRPSFNLEIPYDPHDQFQLY
jgi:hypothetical protein